MSTCDKNHGTASFDTGDASEQIMYVIEKLLKKEKQRPLHKMQPLLSSTFVEASLVEMSRQVNEEQKSSITKHPFRPGDSTIVVKPSPCTAAKLRQFSGTGPLPSGQVDFHT